VIFFLGDSIMTFVVRTLLSIAFVSSVAQAAPCEITKGFEAFNASVSGAAAPEQEPVKGVQYVKPEGATELLKDPKFVFIDTRPAQLYKDCSIKGSVNLEYTFSGVEGEKKYGKGEKLTKESVEKFVKEGKTMVFFCNSLTCHRSVNAATQAVCSWGAPAAQVRWYGQGVPGMFNHKKRLTTGDKCAF
jgi:hypothetical protein